MTGIDLTCVRNKAGIDGRRPIAGLCGHDRNCGGCCEHSGRDDENAAFHGKLLRLTLEATVTGPFRFQPAEKHCALHAVFLDSTGSASKLCRQNPHFDAGLSS
jgi:hypothetical protein